MIDNNEMICIALWAIFGFQHSLLARPGTKKIIRKVMGKTFEVNLYPFFYFVSQCIVFLAIYDVIRHLNTDIIFYQLSETGESIIYWFNRAANIFLIITVFHFDIGKFIGITQLYNYVRGRKNTQPKFSNTSDINTAFLYKYIRHPMYLGILLVYVTSTTIYTNLFLINFFCILFYIEIGSFYEEKSLTRQFGETYINYKKNTKKYVPFIR